MYRKSFSQIGYGFIRVLMGSFSALLTYGALLLITLNSNTLSDALYGAYGIGVQLFSIAFWLVWVILGTMISIWAIKSGYQALASKKKWLIEINESTFYRQTPDNSIGASFSISLKDINKIIKKGETAEYFNWFLHCTNGEIINISEDSPFNTKVIVEKLLSANPSIKYYEE